MLHITNGHSVSLTLPDEVVYWIDILHEGPVPHGLELDELSRVRERFLSSYLDMPVSHADRDAALRRFQEHDEVVLWFEHDLFDQLHLLQLLDWFAHQPPVPTKLSLICVDSYLGRLTADELRQLFPSRRPASDDQLWLATRAWEAFTWSDPTKLTSLIKTDLSALPFLRAAMVRHLEQFPGVRDGLSRTERQALQLLSSGPLSFRELFIKDQNLEPAIFMGDSIYHRYLRGLETAPHPLLRQNDSRYSLTAFGQHVLAGVADHVRTNGIDCWRGGVHLCHGAPIWRWDPERGTIAP